MRNLVLLVFFLFAFGACDNSRVYEEYRSVDASGWQKDSVARFDVAMNNVEQAHNLYINIRNKGNYPNSNIWLFVEVQAPDGQVLTDTVEYVLAEKRGKWRGSGIGDLFDNQFLYRRNVTFETIGEYHFLIRQGMRSKNLKGIHDIGLRIETQN